MVKKSWEKKVDNKGFTLVELIVVLVILAILAAILVPALLGYIDRAKGSQLLLNGKSVLTAAQAEASNAYGTASGTETIANKLTADVCARVGKTADTPDGSGAYFRCGHRHSRNLNEENGQSIPDGRRHMFLSAGKTDDARDLRHGQHQADTAYSRYFRGPVPQYSARPYDCLRQEGEVQKRRADGA